MPVEPTSHSTPAKDSDGLLLIRPEDFVVKISDEAVPDKLKQVEILFKSYGNAAKGNSLDAALRDEALNRAKHWRSVAALLFLRKTALEVAAAPKLQQAEATAH